jgi:hypothetical protein
MEARFLDRRIIECEGRETPRTHHERFWSLALESLKTALESTTRPKDKDEV